MKPIIGIVGRMSTDCDKNIVKVNDEVRASIILSGGIPLLILPTSIDLDSNDDLIEVLKLCDGIIMPGGNDIYPYDKFICKYAIENNIPILGICLGMQIMSIYNKDYVLEYNNTNINHNATSKYVHNVTTKDNTILNKILGKNIMVNSRHNEHVTKVEPYIVSALSNDSIIEGIEYPLNTFNVGVQWHPESMISYDDKEFNLIKEFINVSKKETK